MSHETQNMVFTHKNIIQVQIQTSFIFSDLMIQRKRKRTRIHRFFTLSFLVLKQQFFCFSCFLFTFSCFLFILADRPENFSKDSFGVNKHYFEGNEHTKKKQFLNQNHPKFWHTGGRGTLLCFECSKSYMF